MVHIGKKIQEVFDERGMTQSTFAERVGVHRNTVKNIFDQASVDTQLLSSISKILTFDFFAWLSEEFLKSKAGKALSSVSEPAAAYVRKPPTPMRIVIELDSEDEGQKRAAMDLMGQLKGTKTRK